MKIFTVRNGQVTEGADIEKVALRGAGVEIEAVVVGEEGRGRERGVLPVQGAPADGVLRNASVAATKSGKPKLIATAVSSAAADDKCIVVFRTEAGFRGGAEHTGDRNGLYEVESVRAPLRDATYEDAVDHCRDLGISPSNAKPMGFLDFPGEIICRGKIAQGSAGYMGGNEQIVAVIPANVWVRTGYSGRLYGAPAAHYYRFDGDKLIAVTWDERQMAEDAI